MKNYNRRKRHQILLDLKKQSINRYPENRRKQKNWLAVERTALNVFKNDIGPKAIYLSICGHEA